MEKLPRAGYSPEFMEQAVRTYQESGLSVAEVAKRLSLPKSSLIHWVETASNSLHSEIHYTLDTGSRTYWTVR